MYLFFLIVILVSMDVNSVHMFPKLMSNPSMPQPFSLYFLFEPLQIEDHHKTHA
jgi:hypothetical protein